jgi:hypothetical protein
MSFRSVVREFRSEAEAAIAAATLRANGIDADTTAVGFGMGFHTSMAGPTAVTAPSRDLDRAKAILDGR